MISSFPGAATPCTSTAPSAGSDLISGRGRFEKFLPTGHKRPRSRVLKNKTPARLRPQIWAETPGHATFVSPFDAGDIPAPKPLNLARDEGFGMQGDAVCS